MQGIFLFKKVWNFKINEYLCIMNDTQIHSTLGRKIYYKTIRVDLNHEGLKFDITPSFEWELDDVKTPATYGGSSFASYHYAIKVYNDSDIEAAKFKCLSWVLDQVKAANEQWTKIYKHVENYI